MTQSRSSDPYLNPTSGVLENKLGITNAEQLDLAESSVTAVRSYQLLETPLSGNFDLEHLKAIHKHLFGDIYEWAGDIRTVDISKGRERFANNAFIEQQGALLFDELAEEQHLNGLNPIDFSDRAAYFMGEIHTLHPFREGNSRTLREFVSQLGQQNDYYIAWENVTYEQTQQASLDAYHGDASMLAGLIGHNLHRVQHPEPSLTEVSNGQLETTQNAETRREAQGGLDVAPRGLKWDLSGPDLERAPDAGHADLLYDGDTIASVSEYREYKNNAASQFFAVRTFHTKDRGTLQDRYSSLDEGMLGAEEWSHDQGIRAVQEDRDTQAALSLDPQSFFQKPAAQQWAEASESYHSRQATERDQGPDLGL